MRMLRFRFTVRRLMIAVAIVAFVIAALSWRLPEPAAAWRVADDPEAIKSQGWYLAAGTGELRFGEYRPASATRRSPTIWVVRHERVSGEGPPAVVTVVPQWKVELASVWWRPLRWATPPPSESLKAALQSYMKGDKVAATRSLRAAEAGRESLTAVERERLDAYLKLQATLDADLAGADAR